MQHEILIPELRFPEYSKENGNNSINKFRFDDLFNFSTGKNIKQKEASPEFETPCVRYGELYHMYGEVIYKVINRTNLNKDELVFSEGNEILLPSAGEDPLDIGSASALTVKDVAIGRTINVLKPKLDSKYSQIFVSYYINQKLKRKISSLAKGVSISNVYNSDLKKLEIKLPSLKEQQKIASFLTAIDKRIKGLEEKKIKLEQYKKGVMQQLFNQDIRFKDDDGKDFPDWAKLKLQEIIIRTSTGLNPRKNFTLGKGKNFYVTIKNISNGKIDFSKAELIDDEALRLISKRSDLSKNDIIMSSIGNIGESYLLKENPTNWNINESVFMIRPNPKLIMPIFLYYILTSQNSLKYFEGNMTGSSFKSIKIGDLKIMPCLVPSLPEQTKIANFLTEIDKSIDAINVQIDKTTDFKKGLLQKMFV